MKSVLNEAAVRAALPPLKRTAFPGNAFTAASWDVYSAGYEKCVRFFDGLVRRLPALGMELQEIGFYPQQTDGRTLSLTFDLHFISAEAFQASKEKYGVDDEALFDAANHETLKLFNEAAREAGLTGQVKYELLDGAYHPYHWDTAVRNKITVTPA